MEPADISAHPTCKLRSALVGGLALFYFSDRQGRFDWRAIIGFVVLGYFSFWSGGRGGMLAVLVMAGVLLVFSPQRSRLVAPALGMLAGGMMVVLTGQTELLLGAIDRSSGDSVNSLASGRLHIWLVSLERLLETPYSALFGYGPDAFVRLAICRDVWSAQVNYIVQPHNMLVQWLLDYGLVGTAALLGYSGVACTGSCAVTAILAPR